MSLFANKLFSIALLLLSIAAMTYLTLLVPSPESHSANTNKSNLLLQQKQGLQRELVIEEEQSTRHITSWAQKAEVTFGKHTLSEKLELSKTLIRDFDLANHLTMQQEVIGEIAFFDGQALTLSFPHAQIHSFFPTKDPEVLKSHAKDLRLFIKKGQEMLRSEHCEIETTRPKKLHL